MSIRPEDGSTTADWYLGLPEAERNRMDEFARAELRPVTDRIEQIAEENRRMDAGTAAALNGYDAIIAGGEDRGELVVLNRTALIIRGD